MAAESRQNDAWKRRFRAPVISYTQLAKAAPARGLAASNRSGKYQLYAWQVPTGELTQLTDDPEGLLFGAISPDGRHIYFVADQHGNEIGHWVRVPFQGGSPEDITPDLPPYSSWALAFSRAGNLLAFTAADSGGFHHYVLALDEEGAPGARRKIYHSEKLAFLTALSHGGELAVLTTTERTGTPAYSLMAFDTAGGEMVAELYDGLDSSVEALSFSPLPGDVRLLARTNRTGANRPLIWNPRTRERLDLDLADLEGDITPYDWSDDGRYLLLCQFTRARQQLWIQDLERGSLRRLEEAPAGSFGLYGEIGTYFGSQGEIFAQWQDSTHPSHLVALDAATGARLRTVLPAGEVPPSHPWRSVTFPSSDGREIQAWLAVPEGRSGPLPTILETHGGPEAVTVEMFMPRAQAWLDHGFAYITVNYHGSTTFGREFQESIWGHPGDLEVEDMAAARGFLVEQGIARPEEVFVTGWSYGGFLTLHALGTRPDLWAGGMAGVAVADWKTDFEDAAETLKGYDIAFFGGTPDEKPEAYRKSSPITYVQNVRAPVLIIQGRNDTRCPPRQVEEYEAKMKELGKPVEVVWFDAGHIIGQVEQSIQFTQTMLDFANRVRSSGALSPMHR